MKSPEANKKNKTPNLQSSSKKIMKEKNVRGSSTKKPKSTIEDTKNNRKNLNNLRKTITKRKTIVGKPSLLLDSTPSRTENGRSNQITSSSSLDCDTNKRRESSIENSFFNNNSVVIDKHSDHISISHRQATKTYIDNKKKGKQRVRSSTPVVSKLKKRSSSPRSEFSRVRGRPPSVGRSIPRLSERKITKVREGRVLKKNQTKGNKPIFDKDVKLLNMFRLPEKLFEDIKKINKLQEASGRRYPLRERKRVERFNPFNY
uniref:Uncharacterized protein n=1 Tax=Parastrongyloides trichosuri TaxID=131310 RepID=A0A0N4ZCZ8_PARTI